MKKIKYFGDQNTFFPILFSFFNSCFFLTDSINPSVIQGLFWGVRLVIFGFANLQCLSSMVSNWFVNSGKLVDGVIQLGSTSVTSDTNLAMLVLQKS